MSRLGFFLSLLLLTFSANGRFSRSKMNRLRLSAKKMFQESYEHYLQNAYPLDELKPLSCSGTDTLGSYSLTLIDSLDTLAIMGNFSEFRRVYNILALIEDINLNVNVSVFETNIRIVGGLLSAHLFAKSAGVKVLDSWPCEGPLLSLATNVATRLLPAFATKTGMPYGTVNLRYGVPYEETPVTCVAGVGTYIVEFSLLTYLTGDPTFKENAMAALKGLWYHRSNLDLVGNHINVQTGKWIAIESGIGAGVDSYFEYLIKGAVLNQDWNLLSMFKRYDKAIKKYILNNDWYFWVSMHNGNVTLPIFQSLEAFWPGLLSMIGEEERGLKSISNYRTILKQYGFLPEFYDVIANKPVKNKEGYPLRPELIESLVYLYQSTKDPHLLEIGEMFMSTLEHSSKTECGYATVKDVRDHLLEDRMESFFLAETTKYLYLLFDSDNEAHGSLTKAKVLNVRNKRCVVGVGGYLYNTEAHLVDPSISDCCKKPSQKTKIKVPFDCTKGFVDKNRKILFRNDNVSFIKKKQFIKNLREIFFAEPSDCSNFKKLSSKQLFCNRHPNHYRYVSQGMEWETHVPRMPNQERKEIVTKAPEVIRLFWKQF